MVEKSEKRVKTLKNVKSLLKTVQKSFQTERNFQHNFKLRPFRHFPFTLWQTFKNNKLIVRSQEPLKQGQECFISYVDTTKLSKLRKQHLAETYHFECDCYGCSSKDLDADQTAGGDFHELVALGDTKGLEKLPVHNMEIMANLQQSFDDAVRIEKSVEKAYKFGERLMMGMLYYQNKCHRRPDFNRAIAVHYLFMAELGLALKKDARIIQLYILKCTSILDVTDGPESPLAPRIKKLKAMLMVVAGHLRKEQEHNDKK